MSVWRIFGRSQVFGKILGEQKWLLELLQRCVCAIWSDNKPNGGFSGSVLPKKFLQSSRSCLSDAPTGWRRGGEQRSSLSSPGPFTSSETTDEDDGLEKVEAFCSEQTKPSFTASEDPSARFCMDPQSLRTSQGTFGVILSSPGFI